MNTTLDFIILALPLIMIVINFCYFFITGREFIKYMVLIETISILVFPLIFLSFSDFGLKNSCCDDSALFSPAHRLTAYVWITGCVIFYYYSRFRKKISTPVLELINNCFLLLGIAMNVVVAIHINKITPFLWILGNLPIAMVFLLVLAKNHILFMKSSSDPSEKTNNFFEKLGWRILALHPIQKFPILLIICLPVLIVVSCLLLLFGQKPDSMVRAFTETYRLGLSQLDQQCEGVSCPGHFLCTIAAKGHESFVKPIRFGIRHGYTIKVNRQLLISNAFEELLEVHVPMFHKPIRKIYNIVGGNAEKLYDVLGNKWISDILYLIMKPLEWFFLLVLYTFDKKPENRIAQQYVSPDLRKSLEINTHGEM